MSGNDRVRADELEHSRSEQVPGTLPARAESNMHKKLHRPRPERTRVRTSFLFS